MKFVKKFHPLYFGMSADQLAFTHFPLDKERQALTYEQFTSRPVVFAEFFEHGLGFQPDKHPCGVITLKDSNATSLRFTAPASQELMGTVDGEKNACFFQS